MRPLRSLHLSLSFPERFLNVPLRHQQSLRLLVLAALDQSDVIQGTPALPAEQEFARGSQGRDAVEEGLWITPVPFGGGPCVHNIHYFTAVRVDPGQVRAGRHVGPDPAASPFQVVEATDTLPVDTHHDRAERHQRLRVTADQFAAPVAGQHVPARVADAPALAVVGDRLQQGQAVQVPAQGDPLSPGELPEVAAYPADALREQVGRQGRSGVDLLLPELVAPQRGLAVLAGALPYRAVVHDQPLGEAAARMGQAAQHLEAVKPQHNGAPPSRTRRRGPRGSLIMPRVPRTGRPAGGTGPAPAAAACPCTRRRAAPPAAPTPLRAP